MGDWSGIKMRRFVKSRVPLGYLLLILVVVICSWIPRVDQDARSLCVAESWVANSILASNLHDMFYYEPWLQTTPPLFLLLERAIVMTAGASDATLRALPVACGILAVILLAVLAVRMLQPMFALVCTALLGFSPWAVIYAKELKEYSVGVFSSCLILLLVWEYILHRDRNRYFVLLVAFAVTMFLSYAAVFFVPLALLVIALCPDEAGERSAKRSTAARLIGLAVVASVVACVNYFLFVKPNSSPELKSFWSNGFPFSYHGLGKIDYYLKDFGAMPVAFFFPPVSTFRHSLWLLKDLPGALQLLVIGGVLILAAVTVRAVLQRGVHRWAALFFFVPILTLASFNLAGFYPVSSRRLELFMVPCVALFLAAIMQALWQAFIAPALGEQSRQKVQWIVSTACVIGVVALTVHSADWDMDPNDDTGAESAVGYLKSEMRTHRDLLYVHSWAEEPTRLYVRLFHWDDGEIRYGHTGLPCCKRVTENRPLDPTQERAYVLDDFRRVIGSAPQGELWLLFRGYELHDSIDHDKELILDSLASNGCHEDLEKRFGSLVLDRFQCGSPRPAELERPPASGQISRMRTAL